MNILIVFTVVWSVISAHDHYRAHYSLGGHHEDYHDYNFPPHYNFEYSVHDSHTGDMKSQHETRQGDVVRGFYTLKQSDGTTRQVHYTSDKHNGFNAVVKKIGHAVHHQQSQYQHAKTYRL